MDAQPFKLETRRVTPPLVRLVVAWLAIVLAGGLWQGYGSWLLAGGVGNVL